MKKQKFVIMGLDNHNKEQEIETTDYDLENGLLRYKDGVYDIRTGLWICRLARLKKGLIGNDIKMLEENQKLRMTDMIKTLIDSRAIMLKIESAREKRKDYPTKNNF